MAKVQTMSIDRILAIERKSIISGTVNAGGNLILTTKGGATIDAGYVKGRDADVRTATETTLGIVKIADAAAVSAGTAKDSVVTPAYYVPHMNSLIDSKITAYNNTQSNRYRLLSIITVTGEGVSGGRSSNPSLGNAKYVLIKLWGGGGAGGGTPTVAAGSHASGGGGGAGAYIEMFIPTWILTSGLTVYVGGVSSTTLGGAGPKGNDSYINTGSTRIATAGGGTGGSVSAATTLMVAAAGGAGGLQSVNSSYSSYVLAASHGGIGGQGIGNLTLGIGGNGGGLGGGRGAYGGGGSTSYAGSDGWGQGGGGGGASANSGSTSTNRGGAGAGGHCIIEMYG